MSPIPGTSNLAKIQLGSSKEWVITQLRPAKTTLTFNHQVVAEHYPTLETINTWLAKAPAPELFMEFLADECEVQFCEPLHKWAVTVTSDKISETII